MDLAAIEGAFEALAARRSDLALDGHLLRHRAGTWRLLRIASAPIDPADPVVLVRAGVHGDETSGPITLARHLEAIVEHAHRLGVRLVVYPIANPSGYARGLRYNADHDRGAEGNNDFLRYVLDDGTIAGALPSGERFRRFLWASDPELDLALPAETRLMHALLAADPLAQVRAAIDLHQDHLTPGAPAGAYFYAFGDLQRYAGIVADVRRICPVLANRDIAAGFGTVIDAEGRVAEAPRAERAMTSDADGFIVRHDGTFTDLLWRLGATHAVAPETTGATPMAAAVAVNLCWIHGLIDLVA